MRYINIPGTDLNVSAIWLGTANVGNGIDEKASFRLFDTYLEQGGNSLDTAQVYADWLPGEKSSSEKTIGRWLRQRKNRERVILGTKGAHPELATMHIQRLSPAEITADLNGSLKNLQTDRVDIYWLHRDDENRPVEEILDTLQGLVQQGKIRYFGCSNWRPHRIKAAQAYAARQGQPGFAANQVFWSLAAVERQNLADQTMVPMDDDTKRFHIETGLTAFAYSSQANGWFHRIAAGTTGQMSAAFLHMYVTPVNEARFQQVQHLAETSGVSITGLVLGYLLAQPFPTVPIVGSQSVDQLLDSLTALDVHLSPEQVEFLEQGKIP